MKKQPWLPQLPGAEEEEEEAAAVSFDAVVHFVQAGSGTGVHIGEGRVLTCAHVVDARDDEVGAPQIDRNDP